MSNCRTETTLDGDVGLPVAGLPDCQRTTDADQLSPLYDNLQAHGIPVPDQYDAPAFTAVEENVRLRLQVLRLGDVVIGSCACEAQVDLIRNFKSRANDVVGDIHDGFDWADDAHTTCEQLPSGDWQCVYDDPDAHGHREWTFDDAAYRRWQAQVHNPADGWDALAYLPWANAEPTDPVAIKGNFTDEELDEDTGFPLVVGVGHAGDYNGYTVSYREYQAYDHYRKALTSYGPHTADYMVTWMVRMARSLTDPGYAWEDQLQAGDPTALARGEADEARQLATSQALGRAAGAAYDAWQAALPDDVGPAAVLTEPEDITRFDGATMTWRGGSNAVDNPVVTVERQVDGVWEPYADMSGEVQTMVDLPNGANAVLDTYSGGQEWIWTAGFEAFTGGPNPELATTPAGTYRFVVDGHIRTGGATEPYALTSQPFTVSPWDGIAAPQLTLDGDRAVAMLAPTHRYPRTYESPFPYVGDDGRGRLVDENGDPVADDLTVCHTCSFRAWAFEGRVTEVTLTVTHRNGRADQVAMTPTATASGSPTACGCGPATPSRSPTGGVHDDGDNVNGGPRTRSSSPRSADDRARAGGASAHAASVDTVGGVLVRRRGPAPAPDPGLGSGDPPVPSTSVCSWASWPCWRWAEVRSWLAVGREARDPGREHPPR